MKLLILLSTCLVAVNAGSEGSIRGSSLVEVFDEEDASDGFHQLFENLDFTLDHDAEVAELREVGMYASQYWHNMHRMLNENGTFHPPDKTDVADMLLKEITQEQSVNGTADPQEAMIKIAEQLLKEAAKNGAVNESNVDQIEDSMEMPDKTPELDEIDKAMMNATNQSQCILPDSCFNQEYLIKVKDFIRDRLKDYVDKGKEPDITEIYEGLKEELGVEPDLADRLIESSPKIRKYLKSKMKKTEVKVRKIELKEQTDLLEQALIDGAKNNISIEETRDSLKMSEDEMGDLLLVMGKSKAKKVLQEADKPNQIMAEQIAEAYEKQAEENKDNHTHFHETDEIDEETGGRMLEYVPHPSKMSMQDHIDAIDNRLHRRRLARETQPKHTRDFQRRLADHIDELQGHIRELKLTCNKGDSSARCVGEGIGDLTADLGKIGSRVTEQLSPLDSLLGSLDKTQDSMDKIERVASIVAQAVKIATKIPGAVGTIFKLVDKGMKPITSILDDIDDKGTKFENTVGKVWDNSIGQIDQLISSFDSGAVVYIASGALMVAEIQDSVCFSSLINEFSGINLVGGIERAIDAFKTYIETLYGALKGLKNSLESTAWNVISSTLNGIVKAVTPVQNFFKPFEPLADLIQKQVTIKPWFKPPYTVKKLGSNRCDGGFHRGTIDKRTCYENNSADWTYFLLMNKMRATCRQGGLSDHWSGECKNKGYGRRKCKLKVKCKFCCKCRSYCEHGGYKWAPWDPFKCVQDCKRGYSGFLNNCYQSNCPRGFGNVPGKALCTRNNKRNRNSRGTNCNHHRKAADTNYKQDIFGQCWQSCGNGHSEFLGACFPPAVLKISIQDIMDALAKIMDFISGLPIVKEILGFIDKVVDGILKPVTKKITEWLKSALNLPDFPDMNINLLPMSAFDQINIDMPQPPDLSVLTELPSKALATVYNAVPEPLASIRKCDGDMECILKTMGMGDLTSMFGKVKDIMETVGETVELFKDAIESIKCKKMGTQTVKVSDILTKMGFPDIDACDIDLPYCEEFDTSGMEPAIAFLEDAARPILDLVKGSGGRRLLTSNLGDGFYPILGADMSGSGILGRGGAAFGTSFGLTTQYLAKSGLENMNDSERKKKLDKNGAKKQQMGFHVQVNPAIQAGLGLTINNGIIGFGIDVAALVAVKFTHLSGPDALLKKSIEFVQKIDAYDLSSINENGDCDNARPQSENQKICREYNTIKAIVDGAKRIRPTDKCSEDKLAKMYLRPFTKRKGPGLGPVDRTDQELKEVLDCVQYWFSQHNNLEKYQRRLKTQKKVRDKGVLARAATISWGKFLKGLQFNTGWLTVLQHEFTANGMAKGNPKIGTRAAEDMILLSVGVSAAGMGPNFTFGRVFWNDFKAWDLGVIKMTDVMKWTGALDACKDRIKSKPDSKWAKFCKKFNVEERKESSEQKASKQKSEAEAAKKAATEAKGKATQERRASEEDLRKKQAELDRVKAKKDALADDYNADRAAINKKNFDETVATLEAKSKRNKKAIAEKQAYIDEQQKLVERAEAGEIVPEFYQVSKKLREAMEDVKERKRQQVEIDADEAHAKRVQKNNADAEALRAKYANDESARLAEKAKLEEKVKSASAEKEKAEHKKYVAETVLKQKEDEYKAKEKSLKVIESENAKQGFLQSLKDAEKAFTFTFLLRGVIDFTCIFTDACNTPAPTISPAPSDAPSQSPSGAPSPAPSDAPSKAPSNPPTPAPSKAAATGVGYRPSHLN